MNNVCIECKWCTKDGPQTGMYDDAWCTNPDCNEPNLVYGGVITIECFKQRYQDGKCGKEGKYWEAR